MATKKTLIIVESPAKTRTIKNYLGENYEIMASMGHVRDLPANGLGVDVENSFAPEYITIKDKVETVSKLRKAVKQAEMVYLATDPDREGEAIAWHLREALQLGDAERIEFHEITRSAVTQALAHPRKLDMNRVNAQQARRVLDRLVGYQLSPLLWRKVRRGLSAGRVQSVAVKLVCDREREINAFITEEYWTIIADVVAQGDEKTAFPAKLIAVDDHKIKLAEEAQAREAEAYLRSASYLIREVKITDQKRNSQPPFITSSLQQEASRAFGYSAKRTMALAQQLYEGLEMGSEGHAGLITYMRTDSTRISKEASEQAEQFILEKYGKEYLPQKERKTKAVKGAQEAHEAIRPTDVYRTPENMAKYLNADQLKLYRLIWRRFLASQMANAILEVMVVDVQAGKYTLRANGQRVKFPGYLTLSPDRESTFLPPVRVGEPLDLVELHTEQHFTQPPARYTEPTLIKAMEARGIGRPSTYAPTMSTIIDRRYVFLETKKFHPTGLGMVVTEQLEKHFANIIDPDFTAHIEGDLDAVESGSEDWVKLLEKFYDPFEKALALASETMERIKVPEVALEQTCPKCGKTLALKEGKFGRFVACSGFPECDFTAQEDQFFKEEGGENSADTAETPEVKCDLCGEAMLVRRSRRGPFLGCSKYPECTNTRPMPGSDAEAAPEKKEPAKWTNVPCEKCGKPMAIRISKRGPFLGCSAFPRCRSLKKMPEEGSYEIIERPAPAEKKPAAAKKKPVAAKKTTTAKKPAAVKKTTVKRNDD